MTHPGEIAVVGAGIVGLCAAHALRGRGVPVRVYEPATPGDGQSGGASRIFRHAHDDPRLIAFAREARALWRDWGARLGVEAVSGDGALAIGAAVPRRLAALRAAGGVAVRPLEGPELPASMPALAPFSGPAMLDEDGGSIRTEALVAALAGELSDVLTADEVLSVRPDGEGAEVVTGAERRRFAGVVVCAGRGTPALARPLGLDPPAGLAAHIRLTFPVRGTPPPRLPCLQDSSGAFGETGVYGAAVPGNAEFAVGIAEAVPADAAGALSDPGGLARLADRTRAYVARALPGLDPAPVGSRACWVTELPWGPDGVAVWEAGAVRVLVGHNLFKLAPALGRALADMTTGVPPGVDLRPRARLGRAANAGSGRQGDA